MVVEPSPRHPRRCSGALRQLRAGRPPVGRGHGERLRRQRFTGAVPWQLSGAMDGEQPVVNRWLSNGSSKLTG